MTLSVHRYWAGEGQPAGEPFTGAVQRELHGDRRVVDWTDDTLPDSIAAALATFEERHRANIVRWWLLRTYGGVWSDHDVIPLVNLLELPRPFIAAHADGSVCTCILGMDPGDPWADVALAAFDSAPPAAGHSTHASGDYLMAQVTPAHVRRLPLPFTHTGRRVTAPMWAIHTFASTAGSSPDGSEK